MVNIYYFKARTITRDGAKIQLPPRTEEDVLADLVKFADDFDRLPAYCDFKKALAFGESFPSSTLCKHFECGWDTLLEKAGLKTWRKHVVRKSNEALLRDLRKLYEELKRPLIVRDVRRPGFASPSVYSRRFRIFANACRLAGVPCASGQDAHLMLLVIVDFIDEFRRAPSASDFRASGAYHGNLSAATYAARFGSWNSAIAAAERYLRERRP